jgi:hypothetical protein
MDDLTLIAELNRDEPVATPAELAPARERLLAAARGGIPADRPAVAAAGPGAAGAGAAGPGTAGPGAAGPTAAAAGAGAAGAGRPGGRRRRWAIRAVPAATAAAAAGIVAVVALSSSTPVTDRTPIAQQPTAAGPSTPTGRPATPVLDARGVLHAAALAAAAQPDLHPRPDQFIYLRLVEGGQPGGVVQQWLSVDGRHDGLTVRGGERNVLPGCRNGVQAGLDKQGRVVSEETHQCEPFPAYRADLPTTADEMYRYLVNTPGGKRGDDNDVAKRVLEMAGYSYLRPQVLSALFEAAGRLHGITMVPDVVDAAGEHGVGVRWLTGGTPATTIFDKRTHVYLGINFYDPRTHRVTFASLRTALGLVDRVGQLPPR